VRQYGRLWAAISNRHGNESAACCMPAVTSTNRSTISPQLCMIILSLAAFTKPDWQWKISESQSQWKSVHNSLQHCNQCYRPYTTLLCSSFSRVLIYFIQRFKRVKSLRQRRKWWVKGARVLRSWLWQRWVTRKYRESQLIPCVNTFKFQSLTLALTIMTGNDESYLSKDVTKNRICRHAKNRNNSRYTS